MELMDGITISSPLIFLKDMQYNISNWNTAIDISDVLIRYITRNAPTATIMSGEIIQCPTITVWAKAPTMRIIFLEDGII